MSNAVLKLSLTPAWSCLSWTKRISWELLELVLFHLVRALYAQICRELLQGHLGSASNWVDKPSAVWVWVLTCGSCLLFKKVFSFLPEMLNLVSTMNFVFCLGYFSSCGNWNCQINDGRTLSWLTWPARGILQAENESQDRELYEGRIQRTGSARSQSSLGGCLCESVYPEHDCPDFRSDNIVFCMPLRTPPWPEWVVY